MPFPVVALIELNVFVVVPKPLPLMAVLRVKPATLVCNTVALVNGQEKFAHNGLVDSCHCYIGKYQSQRTKATQHDDFV